MIKVNFIIYQILTEYFDESWFCQKRFTYFFHSLYSNSQDFVQLLNDQDQFVVLKKDHVVCIATEINAVILESENVREAESFVGKVFSSIDENTNTSTVSVILPEHMRKMFEGSLDNLTLKKDSESVNLLISFEGVLTKHDFGLGYLKGVKHSLNMANKSPS